MKFMTFSLRRWVASRSAPSCWRRWHQSQSGATAVEYAVMLALIILVCFGAVILLGTNVNSSWTNSSNSIQSVTGS